MPSFSYPEPPPTMEPTPIAELAAIVSRVAANKHAWLAVPVKERISLLEAVRSRLIPVARDWVADSLKAKGLSSESVEAGEEWLSGPVVLMRGLRAQIVALQNMERHGVPTPKANTLSQRPDGRLVVEAMPGDLWDQLLFTGWRAEIWMQHGVTRANLAEHTATELRQAKGSLALVMGAGNQSSIPPLDAVHKLFVENQVCVVKLNPVNEYLGPHLRSVFQPLVDRGFIEFVYGGVEQGQFLVHHDLVDTLHITGSDATYNAIVWGPPAGRAERMAKGERLVDKPFSAELGNVTPLIVVPGPWTESELDHQAENVATMVANNASFNCVASKVLVTPKGWALRERFLEKVRGVLAATPPRKAYYPGAMQRWRAFVDAHPDAVELSEKDEVTVPWTWIDGLDPEATDEICFTKEPFCGVLHEVALPGTTAVDFLPGAVDFCNDKLWGTLSATILIHPKSRKDPACESALQDALDELNYGSIAVNVWSGIVFGMANLPFGAAPGHTAEAIGSGVGWVHNPMMYDKVQKTVLIAPFVVFPKPAWFVSHGKVRELGQRMLHMEQSPSLLKLPGLLAHALRG